MLAFGMVLVSGEDFPSYETILGEIKKSNPDITSVVIINIFEFKNKYDYLAYIGESNG